MKKETKITGAVLSLFIAPFVVVLAKTWRKGLDEPATMADLLVIFGLQLVFVVALLVYVLLFDTAPAVLG